MMEEDSSKEELDGFYIYDNKITDIYKNTIITSDIFIDKGDDNDIDDTSIDSESSSEDKEEYTYKHRSNYRNELITNIFYNEEKSADEESLEEILNSFSSLSNPINEKLFPQNVINNKNEDKYTKWRLNSASAGTQTLSVRERSTSGVPTPLTKREPKFNKSKRNSQICTEEGVSNELDQSFKVLDSQRKDDEEKSNFAMFVSELSTVEEVSKNTKSAETTKTRTSLDLPSPDSEVSVTPRRDSKSNERKHQPLTMSARYPKLRKTLQSLIDDDDVDNDEVDESLFLSRRSVRTQPSSSSSSSSGLSSTTPATYSYKQTRNSECVDINSVPVPVFLSPLGEIRTKVRAAVDREDAIGSELATSSTKGSTLSGSSSTGINKIDFVTFYNSRAIDSTEFVKRENIKRNNRNELIKYKNLVERSLQRCKTDQSEIESQKLERYEKVWENIKIYSTWHRPDFLVYYRRAAQLQMGALDIQNKIISIKIPALERKLEQVDKLIEATKEDRFFIIKPQFYISPNESFSKEQENLVHLKNHMERIIERIKNKLKELVKEYDEEIKPEERERRITDILSRITIPEEEVFFPLDEDLQSEFDTWILDIRTKEGSTIEKFCKDLSAGISKDKSLVSLEFIELFIGELAQDIIYEYDSISDSKEDRNDRKLALLIQRALFPLVYQSAVLLSPASLQENSIRFLEKVERLRKENNSQIAIDSALTQGGVNPFEDACEILSDLPLQLIPVEMINIVQKTVAQISQTGRALLGHDLGADEIIPFLVYIIVNTDLPGIHETLYMMSAVSDSNYGEFGWCVTTFETAISFIEGIQEPEQKEENEEEEEEENNPSDNNDF